MGLLDGVKSCAKKAKLKAEIALIDHDESSKQSAFGVDLYDALVLVEKNGSSPGSGLQTLQSLIEKRHKKNNTTPTEGTDANVETKYMETTTLVQRKLEESTAKEMEMEKNFLDRERAPPPITNAEKRTHASNWVHSTTTSSKLQVQVKLLEREILLAKQAFGLAVYDAVCGTDVDETARSAAPTSTSASMKSRFAAGLSKVNNVVGSAVVQQQQQDVGSILDSYQKEINDFRASKQHKEREIAALSDGTL